MNDCCACLFEKNCTFIHKIYFLSRKIIRIDTLIYVIWYNEIIRNSYFNLNVSIFFNQILLWHENNLYHMFKLSFNR